LSPSSGRQPLLLHSSQDDYNNENDDSNQHSSRRTHHHHDPSTQRLSAEEQLELLQHVVERRRIQKLEMEIRTSSHKHKQSLPTLELSRRVGYGDELHAFEQAITKGEQARERLITSNMGLVHYSVSEILKHRSLRYVTREDCIQEGAIGLSRAVDKWNPNIGGKFSTYAVYWIRAAIYRFLAERDDIVRVPEYVDATIRKLYKASSTSSSSSSSWTRAAQAKVLAESVMTTSLSESQIEMACKVQERRRKSKHVISLDDWMLQNADRDMMQMTEAAAASSTTTTEPIRSILESEQEEQRQQHIQKALSKFLRPKELEALAWRYGLLSPPSAADASSSSSSSSSNPSSQTAMAKNENNNKGNLATSNHHARSSSNGNNGGGRWGEAMSFVEVGQRMQISAEYGRRLCKVALQKLQRAATDGLLLEESILQLGAL
jgi:RNA polymerase sigma factor (sigma-70 family)